MFNYKNGNDSDSMLTFNYTLLLKYYTMPAPVAIPVTNTLIFLVLISVNYFSFL